LNDLLLNDVSRGQRDHFLFPQCLLISECVSPPHELTTL
jgi:hypothetical protein